MKLIQVGAHVRRGARAERGHRLRSGPAAALTRVSKPSGASSSRYSTRPGGEEEPGPELLDPGHQVKDVGALRLELGDAAAPGLLMQHGAQRQLALAGRIAGDDHVGERSPGVGLPGGSKPGGSAAIRISPQQRSAIEAAAATGSDRSVVMVAESARSSVRSPRKASSGPISSAPPAAAAQARDIWFVAEEGGYHRSSTKRAPFPARRRPARPSSGRGRRPRRSRPAGRPRWPGAVPRPGSGRRPVAQHRPGLVEIPQAGTDPAPRSGARPWPGASPAAARAPRPGVVCATGASGIGAAGRAAGTARSRAAISVATASPSIRTPTWLCAAIGALNRPSPSASGEKLPIRSIRRTGPGEPRTGRSAPAPVRRPARAPGTGPARRRPAGAG